MQVFKLTDDSASATGPTCARGISPGAAGPAGRKAPTTRNITGRIRSAPETHPLTSLETFPRTRGEVKNGAPAP